MISQQCKKCMASISDTSRLEILEYLKMLNREVTVMDVVRQFSLRQPTVTFHINKLADSGVIKKRKSGRQVFLSINLISSRCKTCPVFNWIWDISLFLYLGRIGLLDLIDPEVGQGVTAGSVDGLVLPPDVGIVGNAGMVILLIGGNVGRMYFVGVGTTPK